MRHSDPLVEGNPTSYSNSLLLQSSYRGWCFFAWTFLRSLIHQLSPVQEFDLGFINDRYAERVHLQHLLWLCDLFGKLIDQLSEDRVLFCVIENTSVSERERYGNGVSQVMDKLSTLTRKLGSAPIFILLCATTKVSTQMRDHFSSDDSITVKSGSEDGRVLTGNYLKIVHGNY